MDIYEKTIFIVLLVFITNGHTKTLELNDALKEVLKENPLIQSSVAIWEMEQKSITPLYFPENPMLGIMKENDMKSWSLSQNLLFPTKYFKRVDIQKQKAMIAKEEIRSKKWELRTLVIKTYYSLYQQKRTAYLLNVQKELLREMARISESRRTTGQISVQEEMKVHLEQANIEKELLIVEQEILSLENSLLELLSREEKIEIEELPPPKLNVSINDLQNMETSSSTRLNLARLEEEKSIQLKQLSLHNFLPDFKIAYERSLEKEIDDKKITLEMTVPLWFLAKESGEYKSALAQKNSSTYQMESVKRNLRATQRSLGNQIMVKEKILKLYTTTLIPQAEATMNSSRSTYKSGRNNIMELLSNEKELYALSIAYLQELKEFAVTLSEFEQLIGKSISDLPMGDLL